MISRRSFLISLAAFAGGQLISSCSNQQQETLKVLALQGSIPPQLLREFRKSVTQGKNLNIVPETHLKQLFTLLQNWQKQEENESNQFDWLPKLLNQSNMVANLVTIGDYWLAQAIKDQLIEPLDTTKLDTWSRLPTRWQQLVKRNNQGELTKNGLVWGAPYRWGSTLIAYRSDKFKTLSWTPQDWQDLWREEVRDRISLIDQPREVIGLTLKKLGYSYNTQDISKIANLKSELLELQKQVKFYSSDHYLEPLILGDTWVAVGWSTDILPLSKRYSNIKVVVPRSGTSLWTDVWVQPRISLADKNPSNPTIESDKKSSSLMYEWINFCWQSKPASQISLFTHAISPALLSMKPTEFPQDLQNNLFFNSVIEIVDRSDFLLPFPEQTWQQYDSLWKEIRTTNV
jgi:putative spermidine/putrescine transport system substrate-binding protein